MLLAVSLVRTSSRVRSLRVFLLSVLLSSLAGFLGSRGGFEGVCAVSHFPTEPHLGGVFSAEEEAETWQELAEQIEIAAMKIKSKSEIRSYWKRI